MATTNLGQVRDKITAITADGTPAAGSEITYSIWTECSPQSGGTPAGTFTVVNGRHGGGCAKATFTSLDDLATWMDSNGRTVVSMALLDTSVNPFIVYTMTFLYNANDDSYQFSRIVYDASTPYFLPISSLSSGLRAIVYYNSDEGNLTIDDALNSTSTNAVQNKVIYDALQDVVPYAGATASVDLGENGISAAGFTANATSESAEYGPSGIAHGSYGYDFPDATGTIALREDSQSIFLNMPTIGKHVLALNAGTLYWKDDDDRIVFYLSGATITSTDSSTTFNIADIGSASTTDSATTFTINPISANGAIVIEL